MKPGLTEVLIFLNNHNCFFFMINAYSNAFHFSFGGILIQFRNMIGGNVTYLFQCNFMGLLEQLLHT